MSLSLSADPRSLSFSARLHLSLSAGLNLPISPPVLNLCISAAPQYLSLSDVPKTRFQIKPCRTISARRWQAAFVQERSLDIGKTLQRI